jgi:hypothetical protein
MDKLNPPTLELIIGDPIANEFVYLGETGNGYRLINKGYCLHLYHGTDEIGRIPANGDTAGEIWAIDEKQKIDIIGKYLLRENHYFVIPIENLELQDVKKEKIHPLDYLVRYIENQP